MLEHSPDTIDKVMSFLRRTITEEQTDAWIDLMMDKIKLPWWVPTSFVKKALDSLVPDKLLDSLEDLLRKAGG